MPLVDSKPTTSGATLQELPDKLQISGKWYLARGYYSWKSRKRKRKNEKLFRNYSSRVPEPSEQSKQAEPEQ